MNFDECIIFNKQVTMTICYHCGRDKMRSSFRASQFKTPVKVCKFCEKIDKKYGKNHIHQEKYQPNE